MAAKQVSFDELDLSAQLRLVMATERLNVTQMAAAAGVSKSAMEKYLAGPSSPRATAVASLCANLGLSIEWLLFGYSDNDRLRVRDFALNAIVGLLHDLKNDPALSAKFAALDGASKDFATFSLDVASGRAEALGESVWKARQQAMKEHASGLREVTLEKITFDQTSEDK